MTTVRGPYWIAVPGSNASPWTNSQSSASAAASSRAAAARTGLRSTPNSSTPGPSAPDCASQRTTYPRPQPMSTTRTGSVGRSRRSRCTTGPMWSATRRPSRSSSARRSSSQPARRRPPRRARPGRRQPSHDPRRSALTEPGQPTRHLVTRHVLPVARAVERPEQVGDLHSGGCHQNNVVRAGPGRGQAGATFRPDRGAGPGGGRICATFRPDPVPWSRASSYLRSRQTRSNGSLQACGATSWWMAFGPQVPCA